MTITMFGIASAQSMGPKNSVFGSPVSGWARTHSNEHVRIRDGALPVYVFDQSWATPPSTTTATTSLGDGHDSTRYALSQNRNRLVVRLPTSTPFVPTVPTTPDTSFDPDPFAVVRANFHNRIPPFVQAQAVIPPGPTTQLQPDASPVRTTSIRQAAVQVGDKSSTSTVPTGPAAPGATRGARVSTTGRRASHPVTTSATKGAKVVMQTRASSRVTATTDAAKTQVPIRDSRGRFVATTKKVKGTTVRTKK